MEGRLNILNYWIFLHWFEKEKVTKILKQSSKDLSVTWVFTTKKSIGTFEMHINVHKLPMQTWNRHTVHVNNLDLTFPCVIGVIKNYKRWMSNWELRNMCQTNTLRNRMFFMTHCAPLIGWSLSNLDNRQPRNNS